MIDILVIASKPHRFSSLRRRTFQLVCEQLWRRLSLFLVYLLSPLDKGLHLRLGKAVVQEVDLFAF